MVRGALIRSTLTLALFVAACGGSHKTVDPGPRGTLRFECGPKATVLEVDETLLGPADMFRENGLLLKPGTHRVVLRADGYFPDYRLVEVLEGEVTVIKADLRKIPD